VLIDKLSNGRQLVTAKHTVRRQRHRLGPVLCVPASMRDMNVRRFPILQTVEEESVTTHPEEGRHSNSLLPAHPTHSRRRISANKSFRGVTYPRRHCTIASSSIFSVSGSASNVPSSSVTSTVTNAPSRRSASTSIRSPTTFPGAISTSAL